MKKIIFALPIIGLILFLGCSKETSKSHAYWSEQVNKKTQEINTLLESVSCTNINEFEIIKRSDYYLVHSSLTNQFKQLRKELDYILNEQNKAAEREGIIRINPALDFIPFNPPVKKACVNGKATLLYSKDLSLDEINTELTERYKELQEFYKDVDCDNPNNWDSYLLRVGCCTEGIAVHKTIRSAEMKEKIELYNILMGNKLLLEKTSCQDDCPNSARPVQCRDGKPFVEVYKS